MKNQMKSNQPKKFTKKQAMDNLVKTYTETLRDNSIKSIVQGVEVASTMYLHKIEDGCTIEELKEFIEKNISNKDLLEYMIKNRKKDLTE